MVVYIAVHVNLQHDEWRQTRPLVIEGTQDEHNSRGQSPQFQIGVMSPIRGSGPRWTDWSSVVKWLGLIEQ